MSDKQLEEFTILKQKKLGNEYSITRGFKKFFTVFATLGVSAVVAISATSCDKGPSNTPPVGELPGQTQPLPDDPGKQDPPVVDPDPDGPGKEDPPIVDPDPDDPGKQVPPIVDPPVEDKFELNAETVTAIRNNITPLVNFYKRKKISSRATLDEIKDIYLKTSDGSEYVDTVGAYSFLLLMVQNILNAGK